MHVCPKSKHECDLEPYVNVERQNCADSEGPWGIVTRHCEPQALYHNSLRPASCGSTVLID